MSLTELTELTELPERRADRQADQRTDPLAGRRRALRLLGLAPVAATLGFPRAGNAAVSDADLAKVTLILGDQATGTRALAEAAGVLGNTPYRFRWANFQGAAPLFEAQRAGSVDLAPAGDLPVRAAATGDPSLKIVAARVGSGSALGILVHDRRVAKSRRSFVSKRDSASTHRRPGDFRPGIGERVSGLRRPAPVHQA